MTSLATSEIILVCRSLPPRIMRMTHDICLEWWDLFVQVICFYDVPRIYGSRLAFLGSLRECEARAPPHPQGLGPLPDHTLWFVGGRRSESMSLFIFSTCCGIGASAYHRRFHASNLSINGFHKVSLIFLRARGYQMPQHYWGFRVINFPYVLKPQTSCTSTYTCMQVYTYIM